MWAIALKVGHAAMYWNGSVFQHADDQAARFHSKELAEKVIARVWRDEPTDEDDAAFLARLYAQKL